MNAEVIKAMNRKEKKRTSRKWWSKNGYKIMRVVLFPVWIGLVVAEKIENWLNSRNSWNEERADEILSYYIPRKAKWNNEEKSFYFFDNGMGWSLSCSKKLLKLKDRRFWYNNCGFYGGKIRNYLINEFELEGFKKEVLDDCFDGHTVVAFTMIEK
jgi:hypothetical protein